MLSAEPNAEADNTFRDLDYSRHHKSLIHNCLVFCYLNHGLSKITLFALSFSFQVFMYILSSILEGLTALGKNSRNLSCFMTLQVQGNSFLRNLL